MLRVQDKAAVYSRATLSGGERADAFGLLPDEMVRSVLSWLDGFDLARVSTTCARLYVLADDPTLWEAICRRCSPAPPVLSLAGRTITQTRACLWFDSVVAAHGASLPSTSSTSSSTLSSTISSTSSARLQPAASMPCLLAVCPPPMPEAPPPTLLLEGGARSWRWFYTAMHRRVPVSPGPEPSGIGGAPAWWTRLLSRRAQRQTGHTVCVRHDLDTTKVVIEMGTLDDGGRLAGFGMRAVATKHASGRNTPTDSDDNNSAVDREPGNSAGGSIWRWVEWTWGTWRHGHVQGAARVCSASGATHAGKFVDGLAQGNGVRVVEAGCDHHNDTHGPTDREASTSAHSMGRATVDDAADNGAHHSHGADAQSNQAETQPHVITVSGMWRAGQPHGRLVQTTSCGDTMTATWRRGVLVAIESLLLPSRPATHNRPPFGGVRITGMPWRVDSAGVFASVDAPFHRCLVAMPADIEALDVYLDYVRAGHPCMRASVTRAVLAAGTHFRAALVAASSD
nr:F-box domain protein [Pandoravirus massiliensis]